METNTARPPKPIGFKTCLDCGETKKLAENFSLCFRTKKNGTGIWRSQSRCYPCYYAKYHKSKQHLRNKMWNPFDHRGGKAKVTEDVVIFLRSRTGRRTMNTVLGKMFNLAPETCQRIKSSKHWKTLDKFNKAEEQTSGQRPTERSRVLAPVLSSHATNFHSSVVGQTG